jgi:hypothetical protein
MRGTKRVFITFNELKVKDCSSRAPQACSNQLSEFRCNDEKKLAQVVFFEDLRRNGFDCPRVPGKARNATTGGYDETLRRLDVVA